MLAAVPAGADEIQEAQLPPDKVNKPKGMPSLMPSLPLRPGLR